MEKSKIYLASLFLVCLSGCTPKSIIGHYSNSIGKTMALAGKELSLEKDGTFRLNEWTDSYATRTDENGEIHCDQKGKGIGKYKIIKDTIELYFENNDFITCRLKIQETSKSYLLDIEITDELNMPLQSVALFVSTEDLKVIGSKVSDQFRKEQMEIPKNLDPIQLNISTFAAKDLIIHIPSNLGESQHISKRCLGYYKNKDVEKLCFKAGRNYIEYKKGKARLVKLERVK